ncbi:hypothetical protein [Paenibacillus sp. HGF7]|uniref:hypothetical protein n=1 Tax=Paenibacillus sp. HGF7 TaxID=944559 RepID=UPI00020D7840|nr:hypothetical protein [Paenibacillus sp. HGF7]EGL19854.1 hypothetical protein HMPREF9413_4803 [Paenibacillus sp. HGF7]
MWNQWRKRFKRHGHIYKNNYPEIFEKLELFFTDTGSELPEIYDILSKLETYLGKKILRLKADPNTAAKYKVVDGEDTTNPFEEILKRYNGYLPAPNARWCTRTMKLRPLEEWIGTDYCISYIGIRADENRDGYNQKSKNINITAKYLFQTDGLVLSDIYKILEETVGLPEYYKWRTRSGCYFCFYQRRVEWAILSILYPDWFERAEDYEIQHADGRFYTWVKDKPLDYVKNNAIHIITRYIKNNLRKHRIKSNLLIQKMK